MGIDADKLGSLQLLMGNEAIARGAIEAGIGVATAYPGTPSSEVIATLAKVAKKMNLYVEWSINEKVAVEVAAAAALSGVRAITAMKQVFMMGPFSSGRGSSVAGTMPFLPVLSPLPTG